MKKQLEKEKKIILFSINMTIVSSMLGIFIGIYSNSQLILFDGLYSLISFALSLTSFYTAKFMSKNDWKRYPFGKAAAEPLVMIFNYNVLIFLSVEFIIKNVNVILSGGRDVKSGIAVIYALITTSLCGFTFMVLYFLSKRKNSGLLKVEADGWLYDTLISFSVLVTFVIVNLLYRKSLFVSYLPFVDPIVVIVVSILFIIRAIKMIVEASKEILSVSAEDDLTEKMEDIIEKIEEEYKIKESFLRLSQGRRIIWVEIDFVVDDNSLVKTVKDEDEIREKIYETLKSVKCDKWVTIAFTTKRKWAK